MPPKPGNLSPYFSRYAQVTLVATTASFIRVGQKLIAFTHIERQYVRVFDFCAPKELEILLMIKDLQDRGTLKSEEHAIIESFWRKEV